MVTYEITGEAFLRLLRDPKNTRNNLIYEMWIIDDWPTKKIAKFVGLSVDHVRRIISEKRKEYATGNRLAM